MLSNIRLLNFCFLLTFVEAVPFSTSTFDKSVPKLIVKWITRNDNTEPKINPKSCAP